MTIGQRLFRALSVSLLLLLLPQAARADHVARLESVGSGKCIQVPGASTSNGTDVVQSTCDYDDDQSIRFRPTASTAGMFTLTFIHSGLCLQVEGSSSSAGADLEQSSCDGGTDQRFRLAATPEGTYEIVSASSGLLLTLQSAGGSDGVPLEQHPDTNAGHQRWRLGNIDDRDPSIYGRWSDVIAWRHVPVSAANLPDGRILTFSGSERETWPSTEFTYSATWDPATGEFIEIDHQTHNMFCAHLAMAEDGQVFVNGGRNQTNSPWASLFDYTNNEWKAIQNMATGGRWYPTTLALTDGDMFTAIGTATNQRNPERWDRTTGWKVLTGIDFQDPVLDYESSHDEWRWWPLLHLAPQGKVFHSGPTPTVGWINTAGTGSYQDTGIRLDDWYHKHGTTIMYDRGRILTAGGWTSGHNLSSTNQAFTIDLNGPSPSIQSIDPMHHARKFHNGVMLPDGEVLVIGGNTSGTKFSDNGTVYAAEIWNPITRRWRQVADMTIPRNYHSVGLLMPDARVFSGGGGYCSDNRYCSGASHPDAQIYSPPYLFSPDGSPAPRPSITSGPGMFDNGATFDVQTTGDIDYFSMVKMGATTHGMNTDVRFLRVASQDLGGGAHRLTVERNPNVLTPGYWMLFALDVEGVPSVAHVVRVGNLDVRFDNVAPLGTATQSSNLASGFSVDAPNALDGDMTGTEASGAMAHTALEANAWWELDLVTLHAIDSIRLWNRTDCCADRLSDFYVLVSDEPFVSASLPAARAQAGVTEHYVGAAVNGQIEIPVARTGRFIRVQRAGTAYLNLAEVQVFGEPPGAGTRGLVHYDYYRGAFSNVPDFAALTPARSGTVDGFHLSPALDDTNYAIRFYGQLSIPAGGTWTFFTRSDDGSRLWIDGTLVVNNDGIHGSQEQQGSIPLSAGHHDILVGYFQATGGDALVVSYQGPGLARQQIPQSAIALLPAGGGIGSIERQWWTGISGTGIAALTGNARYPDAPDGVDERDVFEAPTGWADNYGTRMRGYLHPPFSGMYTFWISSDDAGQLRLSSDEDPATAATIAHVPGWTNPRQWTKYPEQKSSAIFLQSGRRYYIEALQKEGTGGDNLAVGWQTPFSGIQVIGGEFLSPPFTSLAILGVHAPPQPVTSPVSMVADVAGDGVTHSWSFGDGTPDTGFSASNVGMHTYASPGRYMATLTVRDIYGGQASVVFPLMVHAPLTPGRPNATGSIVFHDGRAEVWNVNPDNDSVSVIDALANVLVAEIPVPDEPLALTVALGGRVWVASGRGAAVSVIDPATRMVEATLPMGRGTQPEGIVASRLVPEVYVALRATGELVRFDATTYAETARRFIAADIRGLSVTADGTTLLVSQFVTPPVPGEDTATPDVSASGGLVHHVSAADLSAIGTTRLAYSHRAASEHTGPGLPNYVQTAVISPDGLNAWVPSKQDNILGGVLRSGFALLHDQTVRAISSRILMPAGTEKFSSRIDHDNASVASAAAFGPWGLHLYTALEGNRQVAVSDAHLGSELMRFDVGRAPQGLAVSPSGNTLYVHNFLDRTVGVHDISAISQSAVLDVVPVATIPVSTSETLSHSVLLGKKLFYDARDARLSSDSYMACASCHNGGGQDGRVWDFTGIGEGLRNTIGLQGRGDVSHGRLHWTGNFDEIHDFENQIRAAAGGTGLMSDPDFAATQDTLGPPKAGLSADLDALSDYVRSLAEVPRSPYRDGAGNMTPDAENGRLRFASENCIACHAGPAMTDSITMARHDVGTLGPASGQRMGGPLDGLDTPSLLGAWSSPPYLHDGSAGSLDAAIVAHDADSALPQDVLDQLVAYLRQVENGDGAAPCGSVDDNCDGVDDDCDGLPDDDFVPMPVTCGSGECSGNLGVTQCNDSVIASTCDPFLGAVAEICDGLDNDCDGSLSAEEIDADGDGLATCFGDCDDTLVARYPGAPEIHDGSDNQCPGDAGFGQADEMVGDLTVTPTGEFCWPSQPGAAAYEVARSADAASWSICSFAATSATCWTDPDDPPPGVTHHYLVRGASPWIGSWGAASNGAERTGLCP